MNNIKKITAILLLLTTIFISSCTTLTPGVIGHGDFETNSTAYQVEGKNVFFKAQEIKFGSYYTDKVSKKENIRKDGDEDSLTTAIEKKVRLDFSLFNSVDSKVDINCEYYAGESNLNLGSWSITGEDDENYYIVMENEDAYTEVMYDGSSSFFSINDQNFQLIREEKFNTKEKKSFNGYIILEGKETIAAVDIDNNGNIWLHNSLDPKLEHHISGVLVAMLLKPELNTMDYQYDEY